jgi:multiple sugar transport system substrate-binding protein
MVNRTLVDKTLTHQTSRRELLTDATKTGVGAAGLALLGRSVAGAGAVSAAQEQVQISMMGWGSPLEKANVEAGLQAFQEQNPEITVEWIHVPDDYATKLKTTLAGGTPPDVYWLTNPRDYIARGVVMDVTSQIESDAVLGAPDYFIQPQEEVRCTVNNQWYGIGSCWVLTHLYYNVDLFEQAGLEPPSPDPANAWTWDEFLEVARQLTADSAGNHPEDDGFNAEDIQQWGIFWPTAYIQRDAMVLSNGGESFTDAYECKLGEPAAVEAIQALADLTNVHHVAPQSSASAAMGMDQMQMLASGKVAMLADGSWALQDIAKMGFNYGCAVLPKMKEPVTGALAHLHVIHSATDQPDASWKLLAYLSSDDYQRGLCQVGLWLPSHTSLLTEEGLATWLTPEVHPEGYDLIATSYLQDHSRAFFYPAGFEEADQMVTSALDPVWIGAQTAQQALAESGVIDQINELLRTNKEQLDAATT